MPTQQPMETPSKPADEQNMDWSSPQQQPTTPGSSGSGEESRVSLAGGVSTGAPALPGAAPVPGDMDPEVTRTRLAEFLHRHTAYELIPESAKVVVLDTALPVQQVRVPGRKGEPLARHTAFETHEPILPWAHNAFSAAWASLPSLQRSIGLKVIPCRLLPDLLGSKKAAGSMVEKSLTRRGELALRNEFGMGWTIAVFLQSGVSRAVRARDDVRAALGGGARRVRWRGVRLRLHRHPAPAAPPHSRAVACGARAAHARPVACRVPAGPAAAASHSTRGHTAYGACSAHALFASDPRATGERCVRSRASRNIVEPFQRSGMVSSKRNYIRRVQVAHTLLRSGYKSVPILSYMASSNGSADLDPAAAAAQHEVGQLLHMGTLGGVLAAVARHFRHMPTALPLLSQPLGALGVGTFREGVLPPGLKVSVCYAVPTF